MKHLTLTLTVVATLTLLATSAQADPWKNESGKGGFQGHSQGETPWWARGKGYRDGHLKHGGPPQPYCERYAQPYGRVPMAPRFHDDFYKEQRKAQREYEKKSYKAWREWQRERAEHFREHVPIRPYYGY
jgi:hypothetical protein